MSGYVALCRPSSGAVVTWFVTGSQDLLPSKYVIAWSCRTQGAQDHSGMIGKPVPVRESAGGPAPAGHGGQILRVLLSLLSQRRSGRRFGWLPESLAQSLSQVSACVVGGRRVLDEVIASTLPNRWLPAPVAAAQIG